MPILASKPLFGLLIVLLVCIGVIGFIVFVLERNKRFELMFDKNKYDKERAKQIQDYVFMVKNVSDMSKVERRRHTSACDNLGIRDRQLEKWHKDNDMQLK
jgi:hypothetical protein